MKIYIYEEQGDTITEVIKAIQAVKELSKLPDIYLISPSAHIWERAIKLPVTAVLKRPVDDDKIRQFDECLGRGP